MKGVKTMIPTLIVSSCGSSLIFTPNVFVDLSFFALFSPLSMIHYREKTLPTAQFANSQPMYDTLDVPRLLRNLSIDW